MFAFDLNSITNNMKITLNTKETFIFFLKKKRFVPTRHLR